MQSVFETLEERGFIEQCSDDKLRNLLRNKKITVYAGFDPTENSLHLGHLVPLIALSHFQKAGHKVLLIIGGATGMIGDPSGKSEERNLLSREKVAKNIEGLKKQMAKYLDFSEDSAPIILNNDDWISKMTFIDWLRDVGKHFSINYMIAKESVKRRLNSDQGISFTEFSYMTMQAFDFLHLFEKFGCLLQCGGNDQWGNITAGIDLIRKQTRATAFGLTFPLMTTSAGEKFGKSEGNAIWLDPEKTRPWDFFQYLVRQDDRDVIRLLNIYTFLNKKEIVRLDRSLQSEPEKREAQKALAFEMTSMVHGESKARELVNAAEIVYQSGVKGISDDTLSAVFSEAPSFKVSKNVLEKGIDLVELLFDSRLVNSKSKGRRLLESGGIYVNNVRIKENFEINKNHLASESHILIRKGKKDYLLVKVLENR
ncbi:tyrosine--tRNA ligase [Desulfobacula sp.]|uniref:Tyrosine--tRNA ligase n=1 Tax=Candidatus Desulfatibia vada TaxID=2841696 RepID=A0A8J6TSM5_9BACT|nr:tyrosine--tRNA ligase [Candidatus Desulfatibia vada]MBL6994164.1 tyrosine--tRNA ligase [Desulfobacula sp.]